MQILQPRHQSPSATVPESDLASNPQGVQRRHVYLLLIIIGVATTAGAIARIRNDSGDTPFLSANDRSRWQTIAALVHERTFVTDTPQNWRDEETRRRPLQSIDRVRHVGDDGKLHDYSSKPPLLPVLYAGVYAVFHLITGADLYRAPLFTGRWILVLVNLIPLVIYWLLFSALVDRTGRTGFGRTAVIAAATMGSLLVPLATTLSNHLPAAIAALLAFYSVLQAQRRPVTMWPFLLAGLAAGFCAANELPALSLAGLWGLVLLRVNARYAILAYGAGLLAVAVAFFAVNWVAHGSLRPPYAHRSLGRLAATLPPAGPDERPIEMTSSGEQSGGSRRAAVRLPAADSVLNATSADRLAAASPSRATGRIRVTTADEAGRLSVWQLVAAADRWHLFENDDWYDYAGTYWTPEAKTGVDRGEPSRAVYAFHVILGHHGLLSLTPFYFLTIAGAWRMLRSPSDETMRWNAAAIVIASLVCLAFYIFRPLEDRNYGGVSCCFRWMLWFAPLWLWLAVPAADRLAERSWQRGIVYVLLAASIFSAVVSLENPWQHPWIYRFLDYLGWMAA